MQNDLNKFNKISDQFGAIIMYVTFALCAWMFIRFLIA